MSINLTNLRNLSIEELVQRARDAGLDNAGNMRKSDLIFELVCTITAKGQTIIGNGVLEILSDGFGFLRSPVSDYGPGTDDIYVSPSQIRRFNLRTGDRIEGKARTPREGERYLALLQIQTVNGNSPEKARSRLLFETLLPASQKEALSFSDERWEAVLSGETIRRGDRVFVHVPFGQSDLQAVLGMVCSGKSEVVCLALDTPPELVVSVQKNVKERFMSRLGEGSSRHVQIAELALMRAKRLVEEKKDVILVVDSMLEYAMAARAQVEQQGKDGATGIAVSMLSYFWGAARNLKRGGSLTIIGVLPRAKTDLYNRVVESLSLNVSLDMDLDSLRQRH